MVDTVLRAIADDGSFRVIAALTTDTVRAAVEAQQVTGITSSIFGEMVTGAILIRETMSPKLRVQGILKSSTMKGSMVADSHPDGTARGLVSGAFRTETIQLDTAVLQMMRTLHNGTIQQGIVEVGGKSISSALMSYLQSSEQVVSVIAVASLLDHDRIAVAGGYLVQLLPDANSETLAAMTERLTKLESMESLLTAGRASPKEVVDALLAGTRFTYLEESPLQFACRCSKERLLVALITLDPSEIKDMIADGKPIDITCDYCNHAYVISVEELQGLLN